MFLKSLKAFYKKFKKQKPHLAHSLTVSSSVSRPDSIVINEDVGGVYRPSFLRTSLEWEVYNQRFYNADGLPILPPRGSFETSRTSQACRFNHTPAPRPSIDTTRSAPFTSFKAASIKDAYTRSSTSLDIPRPEYLSNSYTSRYLVPPLPSTSPRPLSEVSSSASTSLSASSARLDAQMEALNGVFTRIRAAQNLKKANLHRESGTSLEFSHSSSGPIVRLSLETHTGRISVEYMPQSHHRKPERTGPIVVSIKDPSDGQSSLRPTPSVKSNRTDSGFHRSELDCLYTDLKEMSLEQLVSKYAIGE